MVGDTQGVALLGVQHLGDQELAKLRLGSGQCDVGGRLHLLRVRGCRAVLPDARLSADVP
jgi:hypothetical protein